MIFGKYEVLRLTALNVNFYLVEFPPKYGNCCAATAYKFGTNVKVIEHVMESNFGHFDRMQRIVS